VAKELGCRDMLQHGGLPQLLQLLKQPSAAVKDAVYGALCAAARFEVLRTALMQEQGAMRQLLGHVQQEEPSRAAQALELLVHCTQVSQLPTACGSYYPSTTCPACSNSVLLVRQAAAAVKKWSLGLIAPLHVLPLSCGTVLRICRSATTMMR
jgi:hypothetical protein